METPGCKLPKFYHMYSNCIVIKKATQEVKNNHMTRTTGCILPLSKDMDLFHFAGVFNVQLHTKCSVLKDLFSSNEKTVQFKRLLFCGPRV